MTRDFLWPRLNYTFAIGFVHNVLCVVIVCFFRLLLLFVLVRINLIMS